MNSTKIKAVVIVFALLLLTSLITVGCKSKARTTAWVNTNSMPGNTFVNHRAQREVKSNGSTVVYLGSSNESADMNFGPKDVSFEFNGLK